MLQNLKLFQNPNAPKVVKNNIEGCVEKLDPKALRYKMKNAYIKMYTYYI